MSVRLELQPPEDIDSSERGLLGMVEWSWWFQYLPGDGGIQLY
jgi:hypothetical protein